MLRVLVLALALATLGGAAVDQCAANNICCCRTFNGGMCCATQPQCYGFVPGCICM